MSVDVRVDGSYLNSAVAFPCSPCVCSP
uniref:Uncharacterized protein n=1 Tax=Anguilla anguilla TaxID=7936 RepID=A0A0E9PNN9_ANGAN